MRRVKRLALAGLTATFPFLLSCYEAVQAVQMASAGFLSARAVYQGYNAVKMAKAISRSEPLFENYDAVKVEVLLNPREGEARELVQAFEDNVKWMIEKDFEVIGVRKREVCEESCPENTLVIQFKETGYGENLAQKLLAGEKLRGKLYYIDMKSGTVIKEEPLEVASNYVDLIKEINLSVGVKILKEIEKEGDEEKLRRAVDRFNRFYPIKEEYRELFKSS